MLGAKPLAFVAEIAGGRTRSPRGNADGTTQTTLTLPAIPIMPVPLFLIRVNYFPVRFRPASYFTQALRLPYQCGPI